MTYNGHNIEWVWFDLDNTLIDFSTNSRVALGKTYAAAHLNRYFPTEEQWVECYEKHNHALWDSLARGEINSAYLRVERFRRPLVEAGADNEEALQLSATLDPLYLDLLAKEHKTIAGANEALAAVRRAGLKCGVLSNGFADVQHRKIASAGLTGLIDCIVLSDDIGINKPDIRLFNYAMGKVGCNNCNAHIMIGDNPTTDIAGALNAGWSAILLLTGIERHTCEVPEGAIAINSLAEALKLLHI